ncbi:MAG: T9SS type A sorting domain-containing protein [Ignavibacteriaceae bacterium]|nr:T9SS type A sorting domain-containing protein [Ignavibacteriaceae bacterium]
MINSSILFPIPSTINQQSSILNLKVYDLPGNEIITLVNEEQAPGVYEVDFDAGKYIFSSGVYFYRLDSGSFNKVNKLILIRLWSCYENVLSTFCNLIFIYV